MCCKLIHIYLEIKTLRKSLSLQKDYSAHTILYVRVIFTMYNTVAGDVQFIECCSVPRKDKNSKPSTYTVRTNYGIYEGLGAGLAPSISWRGSAALGDAGQISAVDVEYGFELDGSIVTQVTAAPKSILGKATKTVKDWTFGLRG
jgi:hypothetical protein